MLEKVIKIVRGFCEDAEMEITAETQILEDLEFSSMELFSFISEIEDTFKVKISEREIQGFECIGDIIETLEKKLN